MSKRTSGKTLPPPAAREFDESVDEDLEDEEGEDSFEDDDEDDGLWDDPDEAAADEDDDPIDDVDANTRGDIDRPHTVAAELSAIEEEERPRDEAAAEAAAVPFAQLGDLTHIRLNLIEPDPDQPRLEVDDELAASIAAQGVLQPIVVREHPEIANCYIIVDGERRWRGAAKAGLEVIPVRIVYDADDAGDRLLRQVTLNEGKRLAPMEEAKAWARIMAEKSWNIRQCPQ